MAQRRAMIFRPAGSHDVPHRPAARGQHIGDQTPMTSLGQGFGAHDRGPHPLRDHRQLVVNERAEGFGQKVDLALQPLLAAAHPVKSHPEPQVQLMAGTPLKHGLQPLGQHGGLVLPFHQPHDLHVVHVGKGRRLGIDDADAA